MEAIERPLTPNLVRELIGILSEHSIEMVHKYSRSGLQARRDWLSETLIVSSCSI